MTDSNRPRHSLDDDRYDEAFAFEDDYAEEGYGDTGAAAAGTAGAQAAGSEAVANDSSGLPLRGLAMILIAVAVVLIAWGAFSMFGGPDEGAGESRQNASQQQPADGEQQNQQGQQNAEGQGNPEGQDESAPGSVRGEGREGDDNNDAASAENRQEDAAQGGAESNGGAPAAGTVDKARQQITVLNNSPIQGLASETTDRLRGEQWQRTSFGNLPDTEGAFPKSVVLYPASDANAKAAAEEIARNLGIAAEARTPEIDDTLGGAEMLEGEGPASVVVVTTNDMPR